MIPKLNDKITSSEAYQVTISADRTSSEPFQVASWKQERQTRRTGVFKINIYHPMTHKIETLQNMILNNPKFSPISLMIQTDEALLRYWLQNNGGMIQNT